MKRVFISLTALLLVAATALSLAACGGEKDDGITSDVSLYKSGEGFQTVSDPLSWEAINEFPVVHDGMTIEEGRKLVVDFFRYSKTAVWIPANNYEYKIRPANTETEQVAGFAKYGGLPYIGLASGNIYRLMDYMDPETSVVDIGTAGLKPTLFGNQCSFGSYVGIGRVINSAQYRWTSGMTPKNGFIPVGDYVIKDDVESFSDGGYNTVSVMQENGQEKMYESYAGLKAGDVIVYFTTAGHVVMISGDAHVEYTADGRIDPARSYVTVIDQTPGHDSMTNAAGDTFAYERNVDAKWKFTKLFEDNYVPYTFAEWLGTDPIESSKTEFSHTGETISLDQLRGLTVTSNYGITDIYASVYNAKGVEVYKLAVRADMASVKEMKFATSGFNVDTWGDPEKFIEGNAYTVKIYAQLSTGERPTLWEGKLAQ